MASGINTNPILEELGWKRVLYDFQWNSTYQIWAPAEGCDVRISDTYIFDSYHNNCGLNITIVWADNLEEAKKINEGNGIPSFTITSEEELRLLIKMATS